MEEHEKEDKRMNENKKQKQTYILWNFYIVYLAREGKILFYTVFINLDI